MITKKISILFIFIISSIFMVFTVPDKEKKVKDEKIKDDKVKEDKVKKDKTIKEIIDDKLKDIFSAKISIESKERNEQFYKDRYKDDKEALSNFLNNLEDYDKKAQNLKKDLKLETGYSNYRSSFNDINVFINNFNAQTSLYFDFLDSNDKILINEQKNSIKKSLSNLINYSYDIENSLIKNDSNEELFNKAGNVERELKNIYRQFRAIEWILSVS